MTFDSSVTNQGQEGLQSKSPCCRLKIPSLQRAYPETLMARSSQATLANGYMAITVWLSSMDQGWVKKFHTCHGWLCPWPFRSLVGFPIKVTSYEAGLGGTTMAVDNSICDQQSMVESGSQLLFYCYYPIASPFTIITIPKHQPLPVIKQYSLQSATIKH